MKISAQAQTATSATTSTTLSRRQPKEDFRDTNLPRSLEIVVLTFEVLLKVPY